MITSATFAILNISLNLIFIPLFGVIAAVWIAVATQSIYAIVVSFVAIKLTGIKFAISDQLIYLAGAAVLWLCVNQLF
jgi:O-antigen/teichoic acid export membrane protein